MRLGCSRDQGLALSRSLLFGLRHFVVKVSRGCDKKFGGLKKCNVLVANLP